jgi:hypothetical protein
MADQVRYVDTDVVGGLGDGSSWANAYSSMNAWEAAEQTDLPTDGDTHTGRASLSSAETATVIVSGWVTGASNTLTIEVGLSDRHDGTRATGYYFDITSGFSAAIDLQVGYTTVIGVSARQTTANNEVLQITAGTNTQFINCLAYDGGRHNFKNDLSDSNNGFINCISYGAAQRGFYFRDTGFAYNCTSAANGGAGFYVDNFDTMTLTNCYSGGNTGSDYDNSSGGTAALTTCYSEDGSLSTTTAAYSTSSGGYFTNVTASSEDLHIGASSSLDGSGVGTDLTGTFNYDADGETRTAGAFGVGAYKTVAAAGANPKGPLGWPLHGPLSGPLGGI